MWCFWRKNAERVYRSSQPRALQYPFHSNHTKGSVVLVGFIAGKVHLDYLVNTLSSGLLSRVLYFNRLESES